MFSANAVSTLLLIINCCSAIKLKTHSVSFRDDKHNWQALWKVLNAKGTTEINGKNRTVFDRIILANARERATVQKTDGLFMYQGDIRMTKSEVMRLFGGKGHRAKRALLKSSEENLWQRNSLFYELHPSLTSKARRAIREAIIEWENVLPCLGKWKNTRDLQVKPKVYIKFFRGEGCSSPVGRLGRVQKISIGKGCEDKIIVIHEIGHTMGMWHEQSRPDRDKYVKILWDNIIPEWRSAFRKVTHRVVNSYGVEYDYASVMHYPAGAFAKRSGLQTIISRNGYRHLGNTVGLSAKDIEQVQKKYGCKPTSQQVCKDTSLYCELWKRYGFCRPGNKHYKYMKETCCKTCKDDCQWKDQSSFCPAWSKAGYCKNPKYSAFLRSLCRRSCECSDH